MTIRAFGSAGVRQPQVVPRREVKAARRVGAHRPSALVVHDRIECHSRREAGSLGSETPVEILEPEEVGLVQEAGGLDGRAADEHRAAADPVDRERR